MSSGEVRHFVASSLAPDRRYAYAIRAIWNDGERLVERTENVTFVGGQPIRVDFRPPALTVSN
jgi:hypothetical protein